MDSPRSDIVQKSLAGFLQIQGHRVPWGRDPFAFSRDTARSTAIPQSHLSNLTCPVWGHTTGSNVIVDLYEGQDVQDLAELRCLDIDDLYNDYLPINGILSQYEHACKEYHWTVDLLLLGWMLLAVLFKHVESMWKECGKVCQSQCEGHRYCICWWRFQYRPPVPTPNWGKSSGLQLKYKGSGK